MSTPDKLGYRLPAEWEKHAGTWFTWPRPEGISFPDKYDTVPPVYAELIRQLDSPSAAAQVDAGSKKEGSD